MFMIWRMDSVPSVTHDIPWYLDLVKPLSGLHKAWLFILFRQHPSKISASGEGTPAQRAAWPSPGDISTGRAGESSEANKSDEQYLVLPEHTTFFGGGGTCFKCSILIYIYIIFFLVYICLVQETRWKLNATSTHDFVEVALFKPTSLQSNVNQLWQSATLNMGLVSMHGIPGVTIKALDHHNNIFAIFIIQWRLHQHYQLGCQSAPLGTWCSITPTVPLQGHRVTPHGPHSKRTEMGRCVSAHFSIVSGHITSSTKYMPTLPTKSTSCR